MSLGIHSEVDSDSNNEFASGIFQPPSIRLKSLPFTLPQILMQQILTQKSDR
jgi:hypothetical protein